MRPTDTSSEMPRWLRSYSDVDRPDWLTRGRLEGILQGHQDTHRTNAINLPVLVGSRVYWACMLMLGSLEGATSYMR